jgi:hypothetical protein
VKLVRWIQTVWQTVSTKNIYTLCSIYNLTSTVQFPNRIKNNCNSAIDIIIDLTKFGNCIVQPFHNDLSDHDAWIIIINDNMSHYQCNGTYMMWNFDEGSTTDFIIRLRYEAWGHMFGNCDVEVVFNFFFAWTHKTHLKIFNVVSP